MQSNITVTELLKKLKNQNNDDDKESEQSEILIDDTHTDIQQTEQDDLDDVYQEIDELKEQIDKLTKRIEELEKEKKTKIYREKLEFQEINPLYNKMFDIPEKDRTYKPVIVKEEMKINNRYSNFQTFRNQPKTKQRSKSKHRKYK